MIVFLAETGIQINISKTIKSAQELSLEIEDLVPADAQILLTVDGAQLKGAAGLDGPAEQGKGPGEQVRYLIFSLI